MMQRAFTLLCAWLLGISLVSSSHFEFGSLTWTQNPGSPNLYTFQFVSGWRSCYFLGSSPQFASRCPTIGDVVNVGEISFYRGINSNALVGSINAMVSVQQLQQGATSVDDWFVGTFQSHPIDITNAFGGLQLPFLVSFFQCCRVSTLQDSNHDLNINIATIVSSGTSSPVTTSRVREYAALNTPISYVVPGVSPQGHPLQYAFSPDSGIGINSYLVNPAPVESSVPVTLDPNTGRLTWTPTIIGTTSAPTLFSVQFQITDTVTQSSIVLDIVFQIIDTAGSPIFIAPLPTYDFNTPLVAGEFAGWVFSVGVADTISIRVQDDASNINSPLGYGIAAMNPTVTSLVGFQWSFDPTQQQINGTAVGTFTYTAALGASDVNVCFTTRNFANMPSVAQYCVTLAVPHPTLPSTTLPPTTAAPTETPTTEAPTTQPPGTEAPTTQAPTTHAPTTATQAPTIQTPTTVAPRTPAPTTAPTPTSTTPPTTHTTPVPTTAAPTTPTSKPTPVPTTAAPTTKTPTTAAPTTSMPTYVLPIPHNACARQMFGGVVDGYALWTFGDWNFLGSDIDGPIAVGGSATISFAALANSVNQPSQTNLIVGGTLSWTQGTLFGKGVVAGPANVDSVYSAGITGNTQLPAPLGSAFFASQLMVVTTLAQQLTADTLYGTRLTPCSSSSAYGTWTVTAVSNNMCRVQIDGSVLSQSNIIIQGDVTAVVVIVVTGNSWSWKYHGIQLSGGITAGTMLWVSLATGTIELNGVGFQGSLLAPQAAVLFNNGQLNGQLIAGSVSGGSSLLSLQLFCATNTPTTTPTLTHYNFTTNFAFPANLPRQNIINELTQELSQVLGIPTSYIVITVGAKATSTRQQHLMQQTPVHITLRGQSSDDADMLSRASTRLLHALHSQSQPSSAHNGFLVRLVTTKGIPHEATVEESISSRATNTTAMIVGMVVAVAAVLALLVGAYVCYHSSHKLVASNSKLTLSSPQDDCLA